MALRAGGILLIGGNRIAADKLAGHVVGEAVVGGRNRRCAAAAEQVESKKIQNAEYRICDARHHPEYWTQWDGDFIDGDEAGQTGSGPSGRGRNRGVRGAVGRKILNTT